MSPCRADYLFAPKGVAHIVSTRSDSRRLRSVFSLRDVHRISVVFQDCLRSQATCMLIGSQSGQPGNSTSSRVVIAGSGHQVGLEEAHAGSRDFNDFGQVRRDNFIKTAVTIGSALQDVDGGVVRVVRQNVAE